MASLTRADVEHVAHLARLGLTDGGARPCSRAQLNHILDQYAKLAELDTDAIPPTAQTIELENILREDVAAAVADGRGRSWRTRPSATATSSSCRPSSAGTEPAVTDLTGPAAHELAGRLRAGEVTSREITAAHLARAHVTDRGLHAWLTIDDDRAMARGRRRRCPPGRRARRGPAAVDALHPLLGIPVALKDLVSVKGGQCTAGSRILEGYRAPFDAHITERLRARRRGDPGQDQHGRVRDGLLHGALRVRAHLQPVGPGPGARRVHRRLGGVRGGAPGAALASGRTPAAPSASRPPCAGSWA